MGHTVEYLASLYLSKHGKGVKHEYFIALNTSTTKSGFMADCSVRPVVTRRYTDVCSGVWYTLIQHTDVTMVHSDTTPRRCYGTL